MSGYITDFLDAARFISTIYFYIEKRKTKELMLY